MKLFSRIFPLIGLAGSTFLVLNCNPVSAQTVTIDTSPAGQHQIIDGFGTCLAGSEATQPWWQSLYFDDLQSSMLRMDLTPAFKSPYSDNNYNSPNYGNAGPGGNYVRTYTNAFTYTNLYNGHQAKIAVMGPNITNNIAYFNFTGSGSLPQVAGFAAQAGQARVKGLGDFKLFGSLWSPAPWLKVSSGNNYGGGFANGPAANTPWPFIWLGNFAGGVLDTSGIARAEFDDSALGGTGPTSALTQFARSVAAYLRGFQNTYGVSYYAISIQNELGFEEFYNSCLYPLSPGYLAALKAVRAELDKYPDLAGIKLEGPEDVLGGDPYGMWQYGGGATTQVKNLQFMQAVAADPVAAAAEAFFSVHGYASDGLSAASATPTQWNWWANGWTTSPAGGIPANVKGIKGYGKKSWMTETSGETTPWLDPGSGFPGNGAWSLALRIQQALTVGQESAWVYWQMTDGSAESAYTLTDVATTTNSAKYVAVKHFFRYIRPNSICVNATVSGTTTLSASAFLNLTNGTMTVVLINSSSSAIQATVNSPAAPAGISSWQTFSSSNGSYWQTSTNGVSNGKALVNVPGYGVVTLYGVAPPLLSASIASLGQITLSWPAANGDFQLQSSTDLNPVVAWAAVPNAPSTNNGVISITVPTDVAGRFYRLSHP